MYEAIRTLMAGENSYTNTEDLLKAFEPELLAHLVSDSQPSGSDSDGEGSSGPPGKQVNLNIVEHDEGRLYFKGFPDCDFVRQVSVSIRNLTAHGKVL